MVGGTAGEGASGIRRSLVSTSSAGMAGTLVRALSSILLARALVPSDRGAVSVAMTIATTLAVLASGGLDSALRYMLPSSDTPDKVRRDYVTVAGRFGLLALLLGIPAAVMVASRMGAARTLAQMILLAVICFGAVSSTFVSGALRAEGQVASAAWIDTSRAAMQVLGFGLLLAFAAHTTAPFLAVIMLSWIASVAATGWSLPSAWRREELPTSSLDSGRRRLRSLGAKSYLGVVAMNLTYRVDRLLIGALVGNRDVGLYVVAVSLAELAVVIPTAISQVTFARVAVSDRSSQGPLAGSLIAVTVVVSCITATALWIAMPTIIPLLFGDQYAEALGPGRILLVGAVLTSVWRVAGTSLLAVGSFRSYLAAAMSALIVTIAIGIPLILRRGALGAAATSVAAYGVAAGIALFMLKYRYQISNSRD